MGRAQIYYAANELSEVQIAGPGEFIDSITLEPYEGPYVEANGQYIVGSNPKLGDPILKRIEGPGGAKFREPVSVTRQPTEEEREDGSMIRYFAQKKNETSKIYEIDEEQYIAFNRENNVGIDSRMYHKIEMRWFISGKDAIQNNTINIELLNSRYPGMQYIVLHLFHIFYLLLNLYNFKVQKIKHIRME